MDVKFVFLNDYLEKELYVVKLLGSLWVKIVKPWENKKVHKVEYFFQREKDFF